LWCMSAMPSEQRQGGRLMKWTRVAAAALIAVVACPVWAEDASAVPVQDPELLRYVERALVWCPDSEWRVEKNERRQTPSGSYRVITISRTCDIPFLSGKITLLLDEAGATMWEGNIGSVPTEELGVALKDLRSFVEGFVPEALQNSLRLKCRVVWENSEVRSGALIPFTLMVDTGYGEYPKPAAITGDGAYMVLGSPLPWDEDPVAYRKSLLASDDSVLWDHVGQEARVDIVEFSDFQCPGCRVKWKVIRSAVDGFSSVVRHGLVSFPLTTIHPWAFRAASAAWCVGAQDSHLLRPMKELFYALQREMEISQVTPTARDFVDANELDAAEFTGCYLHDESLEAVHGQIALGQLMGVNATPTYVVNGWKVQLPEPWWFLPMIERLSEGKDP